MPEPISTEAAAAAAGLALPKDTDLISGGDDAIRHNARFTADALADAAAAKARAAAIPGEIRTELEPATIVRGRATTPDETEFVWGQTTEDGHLLPLQYQEDGHLAPFSRKIFREDLMNAEQIPTHDEYAKIWTTDDGTNRMILGVRWDGSVEIPGLAGGAGGVRNAVTYTDAPYTPGSDLLPVRTDATRWGIWGSSSADGISGALRTRASGHGASLYGGGKGGEKAEHIAARLGSAPAMLVPADGSLTIPGSGTIVVTSSNLTSANDKLRTYSGTWAGVAGSLAWNGTALAFTRTTAGDPVPITGPAPLIPDDGHAHRDALTLLWMGKNNADTTGAAAKVITLTDQAHDWLAPLQKRCLVLGHFINSDATAAHVQYGNILEINAAHAARYGDSYLDVSGYLTSSQVWTDTGITPTQTDLDQQAAGVKPVSLSSDVGHLNAAGYAAVSNLITARMTALGWI